MTRWLMFYKIVCTVLREVLCNNIIQNHRSMFTWRVLETFRPCRKKMLDTSSRELAPSDHTTCTCSIQFVQDTRLFTCSLPTCAACSTAAELSPQFVQNADHKPTVPQAATKSMISQTPWVISVPINCEKHC